MYKCADTTDPRHWRYLHRVVCSSWNVQCAARDPDLVPVVFPLHSVHSLNIDMSRVSPHNTRNYYAPTTGHRLAPRLPFKYWCMASCEYTCPHRELKITAVSTRDHPPNAGPYFLTGCTKSARVMGQRKLVSDVCCTITSLCSSSGRASSG